MRSAGLPTPPWRTLPQLDSGEREARGTFIIKSVWEHASIGLEGDCVVEVRSAAALMDAMLRLRGRMGGECFAERFLDGHEYCVAMLDSPNGPQALPPARMRFGGGTGSERVIGYRAKWDEEAPEYDLVRRDFDSCAADAALCRDLTSTALACWKAFGLSGYARVDFRTGAHGEVNIIDINANPCLSPDAGFAAALERAGIPYADAVRRILEAALVWHDAGRSVRRK
nr:hypothetical protein [Desulfobaculum xiamenense]